MGQIGSRISGRDRAPSWVTVGHEGWREGSRGVLTIWKERSSRQAPFLLHALTRPAGPVRFRPSLSGVFNPGDEFVGPPNRLVNILEHGQALCEGGVHLVPSPLLGNGRRPGLRPPVGEKPPAGGPRSRKVDLGSGVDQLEVDEIAGPIARAGDGVELLGDLVVERHEGSSAGRGEPHRLEELAGVRQLGPVWRVGVAYLVVADLERHRAPGFPEVVQLDVVRLHDVLLGDPIGRGRVLFYHAAGEPLPAGAELRVELGGVGCGIGRRGGVTGPW